MIGMRERDIVDWFGGCMYFSTDKKNARGQYTMVWFREATNRKLSCNRNM